MLAPSPLLPHKQVHLHLRFNLYGLPCHPVISLLPLYEIFNTQIITAVTAISKFIYQFSVAASLVSSLITSFIYVHRKSRKKNKKLEHKSTGYLVQKTKLSEMGEPSHYTTLPNWEDIHSYMPTFMNSAQPISSNVLSS